MAKFVKLESGPIVKNDLLYYLMPRDVWVIGNIHENAELLKASEE